MPEEVNVRIEETTDRLFGSPDPPLYGGLPDPSPAARSGPGKAGDGGQMSIGEAFVKSEAFRLWNARFPETPRGEVLGDQVLIRASLRQLDGMRALITAQDASAGSLVQPYFGGLLGRGLVRPLTLRDLVTVIPIASDVAQFAREQSRIEAATPVAEASAITGTSGTKPEGGLVFELVSENVRTIAVHVPATTRIIQDAPQLRAYIDEYLTADVHTELEDQMASGSGSGENLRGILNTTGIQTLAAPASPATALDNLRKAKRMVTVGARTYPTAVLLNPQDTERIDLLKVNNEANAFVGGALIPGGGGPFGTNPGTVWGMPIVESEAVPVNTGLVGDFRRAILFDRRAVTVSLGTVGDDFVRNIVRVLAELRAAFGVVRPAAFVSVTLS
jgi:HK97 family phage major capsid protein